MDGMGWMIILVLPFLWMGYGLALLIITGCAFESKRIRRVLLSVYYSLYYDLIALLD